MHCVWEQSSPRRPSLDKIAIGFSAHSACLHLHLVYEKVRAASQPCLWLKSLLLISQHIYKALSHNCRSGSIQSLSLVCVWLETCSACLHVYRLSEHSQCSLTFCGFSVCSEYQKY